MGCLNYTAFPKVWNNSRISDNIQLILFDPIRIPPDITAAQISHKISNVGSIIFSRILYTRSTDAVNFNLCQSNHWGNLVESGFGLTY